MIVVEVVDAIKGRDYVGKVGDAIGSDLDQLARPLKVLPCVVIEPTERRNRSPPPRR